MRCQQTDKGVARALDGFVVAGDLGGQSCELGLTVKVDARVVYFHWYVVNLNEVRLIATVCEDSRGGRGRSECLGVRVLERKKEEKSKRQQHVVVIEAAQYIRHACHGEQTNRENEDRQRGNSANEQTECGVEPMQASIGREERKRPKIQLPNKENSRREGDESKRDDALQRKGQRVPHETDNRGMSECV